MVMWSGNIGDEANLGALRILCVKINSNLTSKDKTLKVNVKCLTENTKNGNVVRKYRRPSKFRGFTYPVCQDKFEFK